VRSNHLVVFEGEINHLLWAGQDHGLLLSLGFFRWMLTTSSCTCAFFPPQALSRGGSVPPLSWPKILLSDTQISDPVVTLHCNVLINHIFPDTLGRLRPYSRFARDGGLLKCLSHVFCFPVPPGPCSSPSHRELPSRQYFAYSTASAFHRL
jgi:hypothetical protein